VEIGGRKDLVRVTKNLGSAAGIGHDHIIVDAEISVVVVFVFTADLDEKLPLVDDDDAEPTVSPNLS